MTEDYFNDIYFDKIFFMGSLHHLNYDDIKKALKVAVNKLKVNGKIFIVESNESFSPKGNLLIRLLRRSFYIKNKKNRKKWGFDPRDPSYYTVDHFSKEIDFYKQISKGILKFNKQINFEKYQTYFEGVLFDKKFPQIPPKIRQKI